MLYARRRDGAVAQDRWTKWIIVLASRVGLVGSAVIAALVPNHAQPDIHPRIGIDDTPSGRQPWSPTARLLALA